MSKPFSFASQTPLRLTLLLLALLISTLTVSAQTTTFTYQGKLADAGVPANGSYDFQFKMLDALTGGSAVGSASVNGVTVTNGVFTVNLDFGVCAACFNGANRFLAISVKPTSGSTFTDLNPRQQITSAPYAIKSQNATSADGLSIACVSCVTSSQIGSVSGSAITGTIPVSGVPAGSDNYIQNGVSQQAASNFNISGDGTSAGTLSGNVVNSNTQYNLGGARVLSTAVAANLFAGVNAGAANTTGFENSFFGYAAGFNNTSGSHNSFFGTSAGQVNMTGDSNSFFGFYAGAVNTASGNSFFGKSAGQSNSTGFSNSFFGYGAGNANTIGSSNSFFGSFAGSTNAAGSNSFFGASAGFANSTGSFNSFFGNAAGGSNTTGGSNSFFGSAAGQSNTTGISNSFFGFDTGFNNTSGLGNSFFGGQAGFSNTTGGGNAFFGNSAGSGNTSGGSNSFFGDNAGFNNMTGKRNVGLGNHADFRSTQAGSTGAVAGDENLFVGYQAGGAAARRNAAAIGTNAFVTCDDCMVLGTTNVKVGIGMTTPQQNLSVNGGLVIDQANLNDGALPGGTNTALTFGSGSGEGIASKRTASGNQFGMDFYTNFINRMSITNNGDVGIGATAPSARLHVVGDALIAGHLSVTLLGSEGGNQVCWNTESAKLVFCSSSLRYKTDLRPFAGGLDIINRLRPITFTWKSHGNRDVGLGAEDVAQVEPLFTFKNDKGDIEGVKYDHLSVVFINAIKEQQAQITKQQNRMETQQTQIDNQLLEIQKQQTQIDGLLKIVCLDHPGVDLCKPKE